MTHRYNLDDLLTIYMDDEFTITVYEQLALEALIKRRFAYTRFDIVCTETRSKLNNPWNNGENKKTPCVCSSFSM